MSVYAKVTIAIIVLFAAVLGVYYGFGAPVGQGTGAPVLPLEATGADSGAGQVTPTAPPGGAVDDSFAEAEATDPGRVLSESVERALGPGSPESARLPVTAGVTAADSIRFDRRGDVIPTHGLRHAGEPIEDPWAPGSLTMSTRSAADGGPGSASTDRLRPGVAPTRRGAALAMPVRYVEYRVKPDDSMWTIAQEWLGDGSRWDLIARVNPVVDPNRLRIGQKLRLPPRNTSRPRVERRSEGVRTAGTLYTVQSADTLTKIAIDYYHDAGKWKTIYDANRRAIGSNPDSLTVGMRLRIPSSVR